MQNNPANLIIPRLDIDKFIDEELYQDYIFQLVDKKVGGFCVFNGTIDNTIQTIEKLNTYSKNSLIYLADFEYGTAMRITDGISYPHNMALGKYNDTDVTYNISKQIAKEMKELGIHWNLAPVVDINSNRNNPIINIRSYGENSEVVINHGKSFIKGHNDEGVITCLKHFPGHGDTDVDSHSALPVLNKSLSEMELLELVPFNECIQTFQKLDAIMIGHLHVAALDKDTIPASISKNVITVYLINKLNFKGIVITDALDMNPIKNFYTTSEAIEFAIDAGVDIMLMPETASEAINKINELYLDEKIKVKINNSLSKFNELKFRFNVSKIKPNKSNYEQLISNSQKLGLKTAMNTLELQINNAELLPIKENQRIASFAFVQTEKDIEKATNFFNYMASTIENDFDFGFLDTNIEDKDLKGLKEGLVDTDIFIFSFFYKSRSYQNEIGNAGKLIEIISKFNKTKPQINIFFGNPYLADEINGDINIKTFSDSLPSTVAVTLLLSGKQIDDNYLQMN